MELLHSVYSTNSAREASYGGEDFATNRLRSNVDAARNHDYASQLFKSNQYKRSKTGPG